MIRFGTSGWRAPISEGFTFSNVRKVAHAISAYVKENPEYGVDSPEYLASLGGAARPPVPLIIVGFDTRFLSDEMAHEIAGVFALDGVKTLISDSDMPTPAVGAAVMRHRAVGGLVVTASHNPAYDNGLKWMPFWGGAAPPAVTEDLTRRVELMAHQTVRMMSLDRSLRESWIETLDFRADYFKQLSALLDVKALRRSGLKIGVDAMHGSARRFLRPFLEGLGLRVVGLHENRDVLFGGRAPEPSPESLQELAEAMKRQRLDIGLACDGDGDRFGIMDGDGTWISANEALGIIYDHLASHRGLKGKAARSLMTSHFLDAVAKSHGAETRETPVGFKFLGELLRTGQYLLAGEESGGLSIRGHVPEKDGVLACLLALEAAACARAPLAKVRDRLFKKVGVFHNARLNIRLERSREALELEERLRSRPPLDLAGGAVWRIDQSDGFKFILRDGSWLGLRSSGTESVLRIYAEAATPKRLDDLVSSGKNLLKKKW